MVILLVLAPTARGQNRRRAVWTRIPKLMMGREGHAGICAHTTERKIDTIFQIIQGKTLLHFQASTKYLHSCFPHPFICSFSTSIAGDPLSWGDREGLR